MYTVTFSNEELEEMKANDAVVIVSCDDDNGHKTTVPYIKSKYNEVNQNERKAENRCT